MSEALMVRLACWNVNSITARLDFTLDFLVTRKPDLVCLQELKIDDEKFPRLAFVQAGYTPLTFGQPQYNGVGVLVRKELDPKPELLTTGLAGQEAMGSRLITVRAAGLRVTSVYVPNGKTLDHPDYQNKLAFLEDRARFAEREAQTGEPVVIAGDYNLCPADLDTWDAARHAGHIFHTDAERERFRALLGHGFVDLFRARHPDLAAFSWWDYRAGAFHKKQGLRIDLVLGNAPVRERLEDAEIDREFRKKRAGLTASDHAPVIVTLRDA